MVLVHTPLPLGKILGCFSLLAPVKFEFGGAVHGPAAFIHLDL